MSDGPVLNADPSVERLAPAARQSIGHWWLSRARAEHDAGGQFEMMAERLVARGAPAEIVALVDRAVDDEARHAESCLGLAAHYFGEAVPPQQWCAPEQPNFGVATPELVTTLHVVLSSCISEGIASVFLRTCLVQAESPLVRAALKAQLEDEITHARIGWAHLATLTAAERRLVSIAIPALVRVAREAWLATETPEDRPRGHGALSRVDLEAVVEDAISGLILPGFSHVIGYSEK